eukprot:2753748-Rhodomonas_salina.1
MQPGESFRAASECSPRLVLHPRIHKPNSPPSSTVSAHAQLAELTACAWVAGCSPEGAAQHCSLPRPGAICRLLSKPDYPEKPWFEEVAPLISLQTGRWIYLSMSDGTINVANGLLSMAVMADPTVLYDALVRAGEPYVWDQPEQDLSRDFLETIQFPGDVLVSPITFRP